MAVDDDGEEKAEVEKDEQEDTTRQVWRPGVDALEEGEQLDYDPSAYIMYHTIQPEWPCLSFDILKDNLGEGRTRFPMTMMACCGTQADRREKNKITLLKMSDMQKTQVKDDDDDEEESDDSDTEDDPTLDHCHIAHPSGGVNRIRSMPQQPGIIATWSDGGAPYVWDATSPLTLLESGKPVPDLQGPPLHNLSLPPQPNQLKTSSPPPPPPRLLTGDCGGFIYHWEPAGGGGAAGWAVDKVPFTGHQGSVEDLQWSPTEATVFMSAGVDRTVRVWDLRQKGGSMLSCEAHAADVNVISWNRAVAYLVASGSDDGAFKIWDLRRFGKSEPIANFKWHTAPITSVEWSPSDESVVAVAGADNQITVWDLSVEADDAEGRARPPGADDVPAQLLFVHQGQVDIKELHFHQQLPGVIMSTALDGFNVFKPATQI
ncbi:unnamed protein product [Heterosigma akashiwo]